MEYPFKDLLPLDEVLAREGYYKDWTHLDPEVFYSLTQISNFIKTKGYGVDVRLLIAQLAEHFGLKTTQVVDLANLLQGKFDNLEGVTSNFTNDINGLVAQMQADKDAVIANITVDSEVILARGGKVTLGQRLDESTAQLVQKAYKSETVDAMKEMDVKIGDYVYTTGYYTKGDKGNGNYVVVAGGTHSGEYGFYHDLDNGLQVELIYNDRVNIHQLGAKGDGVTDDSIPFKVGFKENITIVTESKIYLVKPGSIIIHHNMTWISNNTKINLIHDESISQWSQQIVLAQRVDNWSILGKLELTGDLYDWFDKYSSLSEAEQKTKTLGLGFTLKKASNFFIEHLIVRDCNAFGFCNSLVSLSDQEDVCKNGRIGILECYNNREGNVLICAVDGVHIEKIIANDSGKSGLVTDFPKTGVLFETDFSVCRLWGLRIDEIYTSNNVLRGIHSYFGGLATTPLEQKIEISIGLHVDDNSGTNFSFYADALQENNFNGYVHIERALYKQNHNVSPIKFAEWGEWVPHITFDDVEIVWGGTDTISDLSFVNYVHGSSGEGGGNFTFNRVNFKSDVNKIKHGFSLSSGGYTLKNINIIDPIQLDCQSFIKTHGATLFDNINISDGNGVMVVHTPQTVSVDQYYSTVTNRDAPGSRLSYVALPDNFECEFVVLAPHDFIIQPTVTPYFNPRQQAGDYSLTSNVVGSRLRVKKISGETYILSMVGDWRITPKGG